MTGRLWPGVLAWMVICAAYIVVERLELVEGLDLPVPLVAALVLARLVDQRPNLRRWARVAAVVLVVAGFALSLLALWSRRHVPLLDRSTVAGIVTVTMTLAVLLVPRVRRAILGRIGLDPRSAVHLVVMV